MNVAKDVWFILTEPKRALRNLKSRSISYSIWFICVISILISVLFVARTILDAGNLVLSGSDAQLWRSVYVTTDAYAIFIPLLFIGFTAAMLGVALLLSLISWVIVKLIKNAASFTAVWKTVCYSLAPFLVLQLLFLIMAIASFLTGSQYYYLGEAKLVLGIVFDLYVVVLIFLGLRSRLEV